MRFGITCSVVAVAAADDGNTNDDDGPGDGHRRTADAFVTIVNAHRVCVLVQRRRKILFIFFSVRGERDKKNKKSPHPPLE